MRQYFFYPFNVVLDRFDFQWTDKNSWTIPKNIGNTLV